MSYSCGLESAPFPNQLESLIEKKKYWFKYAPGLKLNAETLCIQWHETLLDIFWVEIVLSTFTIAFTTDVSC